MWRAYLFLPIVLMFPAVVGAQTRYTEPAARRQAVLNNLQDALGIVTASWSLKRDGEAGFRQDASFYYLTGLDNQIGAILLLDGARRESILFVAADDPGVQFFAATVPAGDSTARALDLTRVLSLDEFVPFLDMRFAEASDLTIFVENHPPLVSGVSGLGEFADPGTALRVALSGRWPNLHFEAMGTQISQQRAIKAPSEVDLVRRAAHAASKSLLAGLSAVAPGKTQRDVEVVIAAACLRAGADGVSWWPWVQTGPNAIFPHTYASFADYRHLNREMKSGELARLDVGCEYNHYQSDVGRTAPVSGHWTEPQREAWDLLIAGFRAGLRVIKVGADMEMVRSAFEEEVRNRRPGLRTELAIEASTILLDRTRSPYWYLHGVGLQAAETTGQALQPGMVVAFEPMFTVGSLGFYLEDLLLVTADGYELLTSGLPYTAQEIEATMRAQ